MKIARVITSEEVRAEAEEVERKKEEKAQKFAKRNARKVSEDLSPIVVSQNEDRHNVSTEDHEEDQISEGDQGCSKNGFSIGDYVEIINEPTRITMQQLSVQAMVTK